MLNPKTEQMDGTSTPARNLWGLLNLLETFDEHGNPRF
jgi:hypothetical protein